MAPLIKSVKLVGNQPEKCLFNYVFLMDARIDYLPNTFQNIIR
jgi:hypothetical protein